MIQGLSLQYLRKYLRLTIVLPIIKLELQIETTYRNFLTEQKASNIISPDCVRESNNFGNSMRGVKSIKQFISMLMQFFKSKQQSLFSIHDQIGVKLLRRLQLKFRH